MHRDKIWVSGLRSGDSSAFCEIYEFYRPRVFSFLFRLTGQRELSEELLQETMIRLAKNGHRLREDTQLMAWLFKVARNLGISALRRKRPQLQSGLGDLERSFPASEHGSPASQLMAKELSVALQVGLLTLPVNQREALLLVGVEGLATREAASILGIGAVTLRKRISRGRLALETWLEKHYSVVEEL